MNTAQLDTFAIRDATEGDGRTVEGIAVTYGQPVRGGTAEYGNATESFAPGAFADIIASVERGERIPITDVHEGVTVGYADHLWDEADGLHYSGRLMAVTAARDFAERVANRIMRMSIEFLPGAVQRGRDSVTHTKVAALGAIAGSHFPAYAGTSVAVRTVEGSSVAEETTEVAVTEAPPIKPVMIGADQMAAIARQITDETIRSYAARGAFGGNAAPVDPFAEFRGLSLGALAQRTIGVGEYAGRQTTREDTAWMRRALADITSTSGANAGVMTPGVSTEVYGIVSLGRPAITAFGGPRALGDGTGLSIDWPYFDGTLSSYVAAQSAQKAEIASATVDIKKGTEPLLTYAGGADISYQILRRASQPYLDIYMRILLASWALVSDAAFVTELESGSVTSDMTEPLSTLDATEFKNLVIDASVAVQLATGTPAEFVLASTTAFKQFAKLFTPIVSQPSIANTGLGAVDIRSLTVNVGNLPLIHVPSVTAGKLIVSNRSAAAWFEDGPFQAQDEDVAHLGRDVAIWSMGAGARFIPAGIIEMYDVTP